MLTLLRFLKPYRYVLVVVLILAIGQALSSLYLPNLMANIVDDGIVKNDAGYILATGGLMLLVTIGGTVCAIVGIYFSSYVATGFGKSIRANMFAHVTNFSLHEFDTLSTASLVTRTTNDTAQIQNALVLFLNMMITSPITLVGGIILAVNQDVGLSWIFVVSIPFLVIVIVGLMRKTIPLFSVIQGKLDVLNLILDEGLTGVRVIRAFNRHKHEEQRFTTANVELTDVAITVNRLVASLMPILLLVLDVSSVAILWFGAIRINDGEMQIGALFAFLQYALQILFALLMVSMMFAMLPRAAASAKRIQEILAMESEIKDSAQVQRADTLSGYVEFQDVTFSYPGAAEPALSNISFSARPGEITAIIGGTGAGKSTLVHLIPRFYDVVHGRILVDGVDVRELSQQDLRAKIGLVPQKTALFSGTIAENIRLGKPDASMAEVEHAARVAQANEFIVHMPEGFESMLAQGGMNISGGQKQRLSIARALVRWPEIYVFDDSFSALDLKTEAALRLALKQEIRHAAVLIVAQRVSTVMDADQILVLDEGRIVGQGKHQTLLKTCEVYREIIASQLSTDEIAEEIA